MKASVLTAAKKAGACSTLKAWILLDETILALVNFPEGFLRSNLSFVEKTIEARQGSWVKKVYRTRVNEFMQETVAGLKVVYTHQGYWSEAVACLAKAGIQFEFVDLRHDGLLPLPQMGLMRGLRFSQKPLLVEGLAKGCSGIFEAPTRFGKSPMMRACAQAWPGVDTLLLVPGVDLIGQTTREWQEAFPEREVKQIGGASKVKFQSTDITICSMDSAHKLKPVQRLILVDEPHSILAPSRRDILPQFDLARKYGFTATPTGRFDGADRLLPGLFGPTLARRTYREAVEEGAVEQITVLLIDWPLDPASGDRDWAYKHLLHENPRIMDCCNYLSTTVLPPNWQTLFFVRTEKQADKLLARLGEETAVAMAKKMSAKERTALTDKVRRNNIKRVLCTDIFLQGVTFHELMCLVNCQGGGASTSVFQKPGRLAEIRQGKNGAVLIDFLFRLRNKTAFSNSGGEGVDAMIRDAEARKNAYTEKGYHVFVVKPGEIQSVFNGLGITAPS